MFLKDDGSACGNEFKISNDNTGKNQVSPSVAYRQEDGKLLVVWQDGRGNTSNGYIYYRSITLGTGNIDCSNLPPTLGNEVPVGYSAIFGEHLVSRQKPKVVYNEIRDLFQIVWIEIRTSLKRIS